MGVVYHANFLVFMEEARTRLMESLGFRYGELEATGIGLAVHHVEVDFRAPAVYDEWLVVRTRVARVRSASIRFAYEIERESDGTLLAEGITDLACLDLKQRKRKARALPEEIRLALE
jgi:acyl-CoA thioester hydrolase